MQKSNNEGQQFTWQKAQSKSLIKTFNSFFSLILSIVFFEHKVNTYINFSGAITSIKKVLITVLNFLLRIKFLPKVSYPFNISFSSRG